MLPLWRPLGWEKPSSLGGVRPLGLVKKSMSLKVQARRYVVNGHVQGVGFRYFVLTQARELGLRGWVRNRSDGSVEVLAMGSTSQLSDLAGVLHRGPMGSAARHVEEHEAAVVPSESFSIKYE
jgi:acylphosphatase